MRSSSRSRAGADRDAPLVSAATHRVAVHRRARKRRHVDRRRHVGRGHASGGVLERDALGARDRPHRRVEPPPRFFERDRRCEWTHGDRIQKRPATSKSNPRILNLNSEPSVICSPAAPDARAPESPAAPSPAAPPPPIPAATTTMRPATRPAQARLIIAAGADLLVAEHAEQLAEPVEPLLQQRR